MCSKPTSKSQPEGPITQAAYNTLFRSVKSFPYNRRCSATDPNTSRKQAIKAADQVFLTNGQPFSKP